MSILNLDEIKSAYSNDYSKEGELIKELASALKCEIDGCNRARDGMTHYQELLERERLVVDGLIKALTKK